MKSLRVSDSARRMEAAWLQSRVSPHFLYNTLAMISGMAAERNTDGIAEAANALADIFRYSVKGGPLATLKEEIAVIQTYASIQAARFDGRFQVRVDIAENALCAMLPRMILQPLVENAFVHGLEGVTGQGTVSIAANVDSGQALLIAIQDNGQGMDEQQLDRVRQRMRLGAKGGPALPENGGVGLISAARRLQLQYGEDAWLAIDANPGQGALVTLRIPFQTE